LKNSSGNGIGGDIGDTKDIKPFSFENNVDGGLQRVGRFCCMLGLS